MPMSLVRAFAGTYLPDGDVWIVALPRLVDLDASA